MPGKLPRLGGEATEAGWEQTAALHLERRLHHQLPAEVHTIHLVRKLLKNKPWVLPMHPRVSDLVPGGRHSPHRRRLRQDGRLGRAADLADHGRSGVNSVNSIVGEPMDTDTD